MSWLHEAFTWSRIVSSSRERTLLHVGFRLSYVALLLSIPLGANNPYGWAAIGVMLACFFADWPLYRRDKRLCLVTERRSMFDPPPHGCRTSQRSNGYGAGAPQGQTIRKRRCHRPTRQRHRSSTARQSSLSNDVAGRGPPGELE
jgi:hypothetical protein